MPKEAIGAANLALLIDEAFDSMNGNTEKKNHEKPMLNTVNKGSGHVKFWSEIRGKFSNTYFIKKMETRYPILPV